MLVCRAGILLSVIGVTVACEGQSSCIRLGSNQHFGVDHLEKIRRVSNYVKELDLPITPNEVAAIVGAAYATSQIEGGQDGVPVDVCFRSGQQGTAEFRVLSTTGTPLAGWRSVTTLGTP